jgi:hypothetical protein
MIKEPIDICDHPPMCFPEEDCSQAQKAWNQQCVEVAEEVYMPRHKPVNAYGDSPPAYQYISYVILIAAIVLLIKGLTQANK